MKKIILINLLLVFTATIAGAQKQDKGKCQP